MFIGDLNGDGKDDIVFGTYGRTVLYINENGEEVSSAATQIE